MTPRGQGTSWAWLHEVPSGQYPGCEHGGEESGGKISKGKQVRVFHGRCQLLCCPVKIFALLLVSNGARGLRSETSQSECGLTEIMPKDFEKSLVLQGSSKSTMFWKGQDHDQERLWASSASGDTCCRDLT